MSARVNVPSLSDAIARYKARPQKKSVLFEMCRRTIPAFGLSEGVELRDEAILCALDAHAPARKAWQRLFTTEQQLARTHDLLDCAIIFDALARISQQLVEHQRRIQAENEGLLSAVSLIEKFCQREKENLALGDHLADEAAVGCARSLQTDFQKSIEILKFIKSYINTRENLGEPLKEYVLTKSQKTSNIALTFASQMSLQLEDIFGTPKYTFAREAAKAIYPGVPVGDLPHKVREERRRRTPLPPEIQARVKATFRRAQTAG